AALDLGKFGVNGHNCTQCSSALHYRSRHIGPGSRVRMDESPAGLFHLEFVIAKMFADGVLQLPKHRHRLHESSRADRMPAGEQPTGGINRQLALERRMAFINEPSAFAVFAQAEILVGLEFARSVDRKSTRLNSSHVSISYAV